MTQEAAPEWLHPVRTIGEAAGGGSRVDATSVFNGVYRTSGDLLIEGAIEGDVHCSGTFTLETGAIAEAKVDATTAVIRGSLQGELSCPDRAVLEGSAVVDGKVKAKALVMEEGARFTGEVEVAGGRQ